MPIKSQKIVGRIEGNITGEKIYLYRSHQLIRGGGIMPDKIDSANVVNGLFVFDVIPPKEPVFATMVQCKKNIRDEIGRLNLFLGSDSIYLYASDSLKAPRLYGSAINYDYMNLVRELEPLETIYNSALKLDYWERSALPDGLHNKNFISYRINRFAKLKEDRSVVYETFIRKNPYSWVSLYAFYEMFNDHVQNHSSYNRLKELYLLLGAKLKYSNVGKEIDTLLQQKSNVYIGMQAPDFRMLNTDQKPIHLNDYKGKHVLLEFWASWCAPCRQEASTLVRAYQKYALKGFDILSISLDVETQKNKWIAAIKKDRTGLWEHISDFKGFDSPITKQYDVRGIPQNYLIDPDGKIVAENLRGSNLEDLLEELFYGK